MMISQEIQREEMYCRNITSVHGQVSRDCFALQWFEDKLGCHENEDSLDIVCVCATDFCNGPAKQKLNGASTGVLPPTSRALPLLLLVFHGKVHLSHVT